MAFVVQLKEKVISIHALREEGDFWWEDERVWKLISIHALREEGDIGRTTTASKP